VRLHADEAAQHARAVRRRRAGRHPAAHGLDGVTGRLDAGGLALFALLFVWQLPHFLAISIYLADDYARGGLRVFAVVHGDRAAKEWAVATTFLLVPVSMSLVPLGLAGPAYGVVAAVLGAGLCAWALSGLWSQGPAQRWARNFFLGTLGYLTLLFGALFVGAR
jgi:protoheme IX farnesyltransferase